MKTYKKWNCNLTLDKNMLNLLIRLKKCFGLSFLHWSWKIQTKRRSFLKPTNGSSQVLNKPFEMQLVPPDEWSVWYRLSPHCNFKKSTNLTWTNSTWRNFWQGIFLDCSLIFWQLLFRNKEVKTHIYWESPKKFQGNNQFAIYWYFWAQKKKNNYKV